MHHSRPSCFQMSPVFCLGLFTCRKYFVSFQSHLIKLHFLFLRSSQLCRTEQSLPEAPWLLIVMVPFLSSLEEKSSYMDSFNRFLCFPLTAWKSQIYLSFFLSSAQLSYLFVEYNIPLLFPLD